MSKLILIISIVALVASCDSKTKKTNIVVAKKSQTDSSTSSVDTIPKVTGIGGIFFYSENPEETKEWYAKNLGIESNEWGSSSFDSRNVDRPDEINSLQWKPFKKGDAYFSLPKRNL